jgi:alpha-L-arabinofuranosidase
MPKTLRCRFGLVLFGLLSTSISILGQALDKNLVVNPGFEQPWIRGWNMDAGEINRGLIGHTQSWVHSGQLSVKMIPTSRNTDEYGIGQGLSAAEYRGKSLVFSGWMKVEGSATAVLRLVVLKKGGGLVFREIRQEASNGIFRRDIVDVPDDPDVDSLVLVCAVRGTSGAAYFDDISVAPQANSQWAYSDPSPGPPLDSIVSVRAGQQVRRIPSTLFGINLEWVWNGHEVWDPDTNGPNEILLNLTRDLGPSQFRFPGGLFSNYYHWQDGVGPPESRPERTVFEITSGNRFGTDEALAFAQAAGGALLITVNALTATPEEAADWVRYINNGSRRVDYWEIGNELYLDLNLLDPTLSLITPQQYAQRFLDYAAAMRAVDPSIKLGADIDYDYALTTFKKYPDWLEIVMRNAGSQIDFVSVHNGFAPLVTGDAGWDVRTVYYSMFAAPLLLKNTLQELAGKVDALTPRPAGRTFIDVAEWSPLYATDNGSRFNDHVKTMASAVLAAGFLKTLVEDRRTEVANGFQLVDRLTQGWIGPRQGTFIPKALYYTFQMFTRYFGPILVDTSTYSPGYDSRSMGRVDATANVPYLDVVSSTNDEGSKLYLIITNKHLDRGMTVQFGLDGFSASGGTARTLTGTAPDANTGTEMPAGWPEQATIQPNGRFYMGGPDEITVTDQNVNLVGSCFSYVVPPASVTALVLSGNRISPGSLGPGCDDANSSATRELQ